MQAVAYLRVSGRGQAGDDRDGYPRQLKEIKAFAKGAGHEIVEVYREVYTGTEGEESRPEFARMVARLLGNGIKAIVVESCDRLARLSSVQDQLITYLASKGLTLLSARTGEDVTAAFFGDPLRRAMIQIQAVFAELEKNMLVKRLASGKARKRAETGRCEGRKRYGEHVGEAEILGRMRQLRRSRAGERMSYAKIAAQLNEEGLPARYGGPWRPSTVQGILSRRR